MAYTRTTWVDKQTAINAERLNNIEKGIVEAHDSLGAINALWYSNSGSDAAMINAAISEAAAQGKDVYLPAGTYEIASTLQLSAGVRLFGDGIGNTLLVAAGTSTLMSLLGVGAYREDVGIEDMTIDLGTSSSHPYAVRMEWVKRVAFRRVRFENAYDWVLYLGAITDAADNAARVHHLLIEDCWFVGHRDTAGRAAVYLRNAEDVVIRNCHFIEGGAAQGIRFARTVNRALVEGCYFHDRGHAIEYYISCNRLTVAHNEFVSCTLAVVGAVEAGDGDRGFTHVLDVRVLGNRISSCSRGVYLGGTRSCKVANNFFEEINSVPVTFAIKYSGSTWDGADPQHLLVSGNTFLNCNVLNANFDYNGAVIVTGNVSAQGSTVNTDLIVVNNQHYDTVATRLRRFVILYGNWTYDYIKITGNYHEHGNDASLHRRDGALTGANLDTSGNLRWKT